MDDRVAVRVTCACAVGDLDRLRAEAHRPSEILDLLLLGQEVDHGMRRLRIHLGRVRAVETEHVARVLGDDDVHPEAEAEVRDAPLTRDPAGENLALPAPRAEPAWNDDPVDLLQERGRLVVRHVLRVDPAHPYTASVVRARVLERLVH